jgi:hypothetical protein
MPKLPWICRIAASPKALNFPHAGDVRESDDPLGAVVEIDAGGLAIARTTKVTDVRQETTDDN